MDEREFTPFAPRRVTVTPRRQPGAAMEEKDALEDVQPDPRCIEAKETSAECESPAASIIEPDSDPKNVHPDEAPALCPAPGEDERSQPAIAPAAPLQDEEADKPSRCCDHTFEIRNEAIRLAAIACGRALRHAVMIHPAIIAAFVDDALRAAGERAVQRIHVHASVASHVSAERGLVQPEEGMAPGDLLIEVDGGTIGAELQMRAELLVAAAAG